MKPEALLPGVTLVTCCRDRSANLCLALPTWLALPGIDEIVVVDWTSASPVAADLLAADLTDPRIRVVRVEEEPDWVLSRAFNLGFRLARYDRILKVDADIQLAQEFFESNRLEQGHFCAGNWRLAGPGQQFVNGFFYIHNADLMRVNGFNEYVTGYGWDDDDLYERLTATGLNRCDVAPGSLYHLVHDDVARTLPVRAGQTGWDDLRAQRMFAIRTNRFVAGIMPQWGPGQRGAEYVTLHAVPLTLRGGDPAGVTVPPHQRRRAETLAAYEMLGWRAGPRVHDLSARMLDLLLCACSWEGITALHVELMLAGAQIATVVAPHHLVADLVVPALQARPEALAALCKLLQAAADATGRVLVLRARRVPLGMAALAHLPQIPAQHPLGPVTDIVLEQSLHDAQTPVLRVRIGPDQMEALFPRKAPSAAPVLSRPGAGRIYVDAQHGLGNRLRAIASAGAIAQATGREMVVIWQPDAHCAARFADLFAPGPAVIEQGFTTEAVARGMDLLNYMEIESGAQKGAPLCLTEGRDAYLRSAYVIAHEASHWASEVAVLRALRPAAAVQALVAGMPPFDVGLHVRAQGAPGDALAPCDAPANWNAESHAAIQHARAQSQPARFVAPLEAIWRHSPKARVFLAADRPETYAMFDRLYGAQIIWLARDTWDRSAVQMQYALADALLLARAQHLLGSNWSSFSELALRLSVRVRRYERSGIDF